MVMMMGLVESSMVRERCLVQMLYVVVMDAGHHPPGTLLLTLHHDHQLCCFCCILEQACEGRQRGG